MISKLVSRRFQKFQRMNHSSCDKCGFVGFRLLRLMSKITAKRKVDVILEKLFVYCDPEQLLYNFTGK